MQKILLYCQMRGTIIEPTILVLSAGTNDFEIALEATGKIGDYTYSLNCLSSYSS